MRKAIIMGMLILFTSALYGQVDSAKVLLKAKATKGTIKLRWAPSTPMAWYYANKYGYTLEKIVFMENGKIIKSRHREVIMPSPIVPRPLVDWETLVDQDDYAGVAAQAIYGESFEVNDQFSSPMIRAINQARELQNRFSFALYSADMSVQAAAFSGLYYEDKQVDNDYKYLYRIYANVPETVLKMDTTGVLIGLEDFKELPAVNDVQVDFRDQIAVITWTPISNKIYNAYWVEKSTNGIDFERLTDAPMVFPETSKSGRTQPLYKADSITDNQSTFYYRVIGIDAFGDLGAPSRVVSGNGIPVFNYAAVIKSGVIDSIGGSVRVSWEFPHQGVELLNHFALYRQNLSTKTRTLIQDDISKDRRTIDDNQPLSSNYYIVEAIDWYDRRTSSFPYFVQLEDSIPPAIPTGLAGIIDTLGHVFLKWDKNNEPDLSGYKLYRSNFEDGEFVAVPGPMIATTEFVDTLYLKTLTESVYYKLRAFDTRFNPSDFSQPLKLKKPDLIPPVTPVFKGIENDTSGVLLTWELSPSEDVEKYLLYRRSEEESDWALIKQFEDERPQYYLDDQVKHGIRYAYTIVAVDDDGLESAPANPMVALWKSRHPHQPITSIFTKIDPSKRSVLLEWEYNESDVAGYLIYKQKNEASLALFKDVRGSQSELLDQYTLADRAFIYRIMVVFTNGEKSPLSDEIRVEFKN